MAALKDAVRKLMGHGVTNLIKLSEGGFNRIFLLTLEDEFQVVVKIPYHLTVPRTYATASEVATLVFLRSKGIAVRVVSHSRQSCRS